MGICLDTEDCRFQNLDQARFCAKCGIPTRGALLQGRYEIQDLIGKDHSTITLRATDRHEGLPVTVRALLPDKTSAEERDIFLQDAELAFALSSRINETGSIRVIDYGQDGPITFLVKSEAPARLANDAGASAAAQPGKSKGELDASMAEKHTAKRHMTVRVGSDILQPAHLPDDDYETEGDMLTELRPTIPKASNKIPNGTPMEVPQQAFIHQYPGTNPSRQRRYASAAQPGETKGERDWLAEGDRAYEQGNYEDALTAYEAALAMAPTHLPNDATRLPLRGQASREENDAVSAEAWSGKGATLLHLGYIEEALLAYNQALLLHPNDPDLWNSRAHVLHELRLYDEEMHCYDQALALDPNYVFAWSGRGMTLVEQNRYEEALLAFDRALVLDATQGVIWQAMSDTLYSLQRYEDALLAINLALDLDPDNAAMWDIKGNILRRMHRPDQALPLHEHATLLSPDSAIAWFDKANDLRDLKRYAEALADYDRALSLDLTLGGAWYNRGNVLAAMHMYEDALESYDQALQYDDGLISAWYNKGSLLHELRRDEEALIAFDYALALDTRYSAAWNNKGLSLFTLGYLEEALAAFDQATSFAPDEPDAWYNKAIVLEMLARSEEALSCQERARILEQLVIK